MIYLCVFFHFWSGYVCFGCVFDDHVEYVELHHISDKAMTFGIYQCKITKDVYWVCIEFVFWYIKAPRWAKQHWSVLAQIERVLLRIAASDSASGCASRWAKLRACCASQRAKQRAGFTECCSSESGEMQRFVIFWRWQCYVHAKCGLYLYFMRTIVCNACRYEICV